MGGGLTRLQRCSQCILQPQPTERIIFCVIEYIYIYIVIHKQICFVIYIYIYIYIYMCVCICTHPNVNTSYLSQWKLKQVVKIEIRRLKDLVFCYMSIFLHRHRPLDLFIKVKLDFAFNGYKRLAIF